MKKLKKPRKDFAGDLIRVNILKQEIALYKTMLRDHDTGHIHTTISFLQERVDHLEGKCKEMYVPEFQE